MTGWYYIVTGLSLALLVFLAWMEGRRVNRARLGLRIAAVLLAVLSLAFLELPVSYKRKVLPAAGAGTAVLLTEGYDRDSLKVFMDNAPAGIRVLSYDNLAMGAAIPSGSAGLSVFGYGLKRAEWERLETAAGGAGLPALSFHPPVISTGLLSVDWRRHIPAGGRLQVQGRIYRKDDAPLKLELQGFSSLLDSVVLKGGKGMQGVHHFELSAIPPQTGRALYRLLVLSGRDTLEQEWLPTEVSALQNVRVLLLAATPDFENRFLAGWLAKNGYALAMRTAISRNKFDRAWLNMPEISLDHVDAGLLDRFDLVIADGAALHELTAGEAGALQNQVSAKGLGLIIKGDSAAGLSFYRHLFSLAAVKDSTQSPYIKEGPGILALQRDSGARMLVGERLYGRGRLLLTMEQHTYTDMLAGRGEEYAAGWTRLLSAAGKAEEPAGEWSFMPARPCVGEPVDVRLETGIPGLQQGRIGDAAVYLDQDPVLTQYRKGMYWPEQAGWQQVSGLQADSAWLYIWGAGEWRQQRQRERWEETMQYISGRTGAAPAAGAENPAGADTRRVQVAKTWFYAIFLMSCLFLWVERKI